MSNGDAKNLIAGTSEPAPRGGSKMALDELFGRFNDNLRRVARALQWNPSSTLNATALVDESYLKLVRSPVPATETEFIKIAASAMRQCLVDAARRKQAQKRGHEVAFVSSLDVGQEMGLSAEESLSLHQALDELDEVEIRQRRIVDCKFFLGLSNAETAGVLGISEKTVEREWRVAKAWITARIRPARG